MELTISIPKPSQKLGRTKSLAPFIKAGLSLSGTKSVNTTRPANFSFLACSKIGPNNQPFLPAITNLYSPCFPQICFQSDKRPTMFLLGLRVLRNKMYFSPKEYFCLILRMACSVTLLVKTEEAPDNIVTLTLLLA